MKTLRFSLFFVLILVGFTSCLKDKCEREITYTKAVPVLLNESDIRKEVKTDAPRSLINPGKIYLHGNNIFINEFKEGFHIIDNTDPQNPANIGFVAVPGNVDIAVNGNILYADNYLDLLAIDISNPSNVKLAKRVENTFRMFGANDNASLIIDYQLEEITEKIDCEENFAWDDGDIVFLTTTSNGQEVSPSAGATADASRAIHGTSGSMSRFAVVQDYLYILDYENMFTYDITQADCPNFIDEVGMGWVTNVETIFPYEDHLFIGANNGMFIFDNTNPSSPTFKSAFQHATACDPVYIKEDYAYVTLRTGNPCEGFINQMDVVDISNLDNPTLAASFEMANPHGLTIKDDALFLCEGKSGLKAFDVSSPTAVGDNLLSQIRDMDAYDVIAIPGNENVLMVIGKDGFYQYNSSNPADLRLISVIPTE